VYRYLSFTAAALLSAATAVYAAPPAAAPPANTPNPRDRMVCRNYLDTGSLVRSTRVCKTRREWDAEVANIRQPTSDINSCRNTGIGLPC
jgi:hypothetical protein